MNKKDNIFEKLKKTDWEFVNDETDFATHNIHRYSSKYIPQIPEKLINTLTKKGDVILDPFLGSGTTLLEANRLSRNSIGIDISPVAILISKVKTTPINIADLDKQINIFLNSISPKITFIRSDGKKKDLFNPKLKIVKYKLPKFKRATDWYQPEVLKELSIIKDFINEEINDKKIQLFFVCAFSAIVRPVSNANTGYGNLMIDKNKKSILNTFEIYQRQLLKMRKSIIDLKKIYRSDYNIKIIQGDCQNLKLIKDNSIDSIITHPPYISAVPYAEYLMLSLVWLEDCFADIFKGEFSEQLNFKKLDESIIGGKRNRMDVVERFEKSMYETFSEMYRVLKPKKYCSVVIGNPVVRGKLIECDKMFINIAKKIGFKTMSIIQRGKYKTTMGKMKEEFILIFRK